jgi:hypothetical protein
MIRGISVEMAGQTFVVPPLTFRQIRELQPVIQKVATIDGVPTSEHVTGIAEIVRAALGRNYPELTTEAVEDLLDMGNFNAVLLAVLRGSGLVSEGEAEAAGI